MKCVSKSISSACAAQNCVSCLIGLVTPRSCYSRLHTASTSLEFLEGDILSLSFVIHTKVLRPGVLSISVTPQEGCSAGQKRCFCTFICAWLANNAKRNTPTLGGWAILGRRTNTTSFLFLFLQTSCNPPSRLRPPPMILRS